MLNPLETTSRKMEQKIFWSRLSLSPQTRISRLSSWTTAQAILFCRERNSTKRQNFTSTEKLWSLNKLRHWELHLMLHRLSVKPQQTVVQPRKELWTKPLRSSLHCETKGRLLSHRAQPESRERWRQLGALAGWTMNLLRINQVFKNRSRRGRKTSYNWD